MRKLPLLIFTFAIGATSGAVQLWANPADLSLGLGVKFNSTNTKTGSGTVHQDLGRSTEVAVSAFLGTFGLEGFAKRLTYDKVRSQSGAGEIDHIAFNDTIYGAGLNLSGHGLMMRAGIAQHSMTAKQLVAYKTISGFPRGTDRGEYYGLGFFGSLTPDADLTFEFVHFRLPESRYQINEVNVGLRAYLIGGSGPKKSGK